MTVILFNNEGFSEPQAIGADLNSGNMRMFAIRRQRPTELISLGGHPVNDAPTYNLTEGKTVPVYRHINGRNILEEKAISSGIVKSMSQNVMLPNRILSVTNEISRLQDRYTYDVVYVPNSCFENCDQYFWLSRDIRFDPVQIQNAVVGYDENEGAINRQRVMKSTGQLVEYRGLDSRIIGTSTGNIITSVVRFEQGCSSGTCSDKNLIQIGTDDLATPTTSIVQYTTDGGVTWTSFTTTALGALVGMDAIFYDDKLIIVSTDKPSGAASTTGKIVYSALGGTLTEATLDTPATGGFYTIDKIGSTLFAFGKQVYKSCDAGLTWNAVTSPITEIILSSAFDKYNNQIILGTTNGEVWLFNGVIFTELTGLPATPGNITAIGVVTQNGYIAGDVAGKIYEVYELDNIVDAWSVKTLGSTAIRSIVTDDYGYRVLVNVGTSIYERSAFTLQEWTSLTGLATTGSYYSIISGEIFPNEGVNAFFGGTDAGELVQIATCGRCFGSNC